MILDLKIDSFIKFVSHHIVSFWEMGLNFGQWLGIGDTVSLQSLGHKMLNPLQPLKTMCLMKEVTKGLSPAFTVNILTALL
jgi:hypothetical protein